MKVTIGKYPRYISAYHIANKLIFWDDDKAERFGEWLAFTWVGTLLENMHKRQRRKIKIKIDPYDVWNIDTTLAYIIVPLLKKFRENPSGYAFVKDEDVPEYLHDPIITETGSPNYDHVDVNGYKKTDVLGRRRWDYVLGEIEYAFQSLINEETRFEYTTDEWDRRANGYRLFGAYLPNLWD